MSLHDKLAASQAATRRGIIAKASRLKHDMEEILQSMTNGGEPPTYTGLMGEEFARLMAYVGEYQANASLMLTLKHTDQQAPNSKGQDDVARVGPGPCSHAGECGCPTLAML